MRIVKINSQKLRAFYGKMPLLLAVFMVSLLGIYTYTRVSGTDQASAAVSSNLNFQARLYQSSGSLVPDGYYNIEFNLYDVSVAGTSLWTETYYDSNGVTAGNDNRVRVVNGYFTVNLGSLNAFPGTINWDQEHWLTMNVGGSTQTATPTYDGEMTPRLKLTATPFAFESGSAKKLIEDQLNGTGTLEWLTLTQDRTVSLPDASGTVLLDSTGFVNGGNGFSGTATLGTNDTNDLILETGGVEGLRIDQDGDVGIGTLADAVESLEVNGGIKLGNTTNTNAGTLRWTGTDFEGYDGTTWKSLTVGNEGTATGSFVSGLANVGANVTGTPVETLVFTSATGVSNTAGVTGFTAPANGSFTSCLIKNNAAITAGTLNLRWRVNGASTGAAACPMNNGANNRQSATALSNGSVTFSAGDTIGIAFDTVGMAPITNDFTVYWTVEYVTGGGGSAVGTFTQGGNSFGTTAVLGTMDNNALEFITNGSTALTITSTGSAQFASGIQTNSVDRATAGALAIGDTVATSISLCNSGACDLVTIGTNADADTVQIGDSLDTLTLTGNASSEIVWNGVSISASELTLLDGRDASLIDTNDSVNTAITGTGILDAGSITANFGSIDIGADSFTTTGLVFANNFDRSTAGALTFGDTNATSVGICNSANCDTITIGTNADADVIQMGDGTDTVTITGDASSQIIWNGVAISTSELTVLDGGLDETEVTGEIEAVTAGGGLTGGGTADSITLDIASANGGIVINTDDIALTLAASADGLSGTTASGSGLEILSSGLSLIQGCSNNQILQWNETTDVWACQTYDLDMTYAVDTDKILDVNTASGLVFDLTSTGDFIIRDSGTPIATFGNNGAITFDTSVNQNFTVDFSGTGYLDINAVTYLNNIGAVDITRTGNFTGVGAENANEFRIAPGLTLTEPGSGTFRWNGANIDMSGISVTAGAGTSEIVGLRIAGVSDADAGTVLGIDLANITPTAATEYGINIGTGWDAGINFNDTTPTLRFGMTDNTGVLSVVDSAATPNTLLRIQDHSTNFGASVEAGAFIDYNSMYVDEFFKDRAQVAADGNQNWGDNTEWNTNETGTCTWDGVADGINGVTSMVANAAGSTCTLHHSDLGANTPNTWIDADFLPTMVMKVRPSVAGAGVPDANHQFFAGAYDGGFNATPASGAPLNGIYFTNADNVAGTNGTANWHAVTDNGAAATVTPCGVAVSETSFALLVIKVMSTSLVRFYIDNDVSNGISLTECGTGNTANINTAGMTPFVKADWDAAANASTLETDFYRIWQDDAPAGGPDNTTTEQPVQEQSTPIEVSGEPTLSSSDILSSLLVASESMENTSPEDLNVERIIASKGVIATDITTGGLSTNSITPATEDTLSINLGEDQNVSVRDAIGDEKITFDALGNASFDGTITAENIKILGDEGLDYGSELQNLSARIDSLQTQISSQTLQNIELNNVETGLLSVDGLAVFNAETIFGNDVSISGDVAVLGATTVQSFTVELDLIAKGAITVEGKATFKEAVKFEKDVEFNGDVSVNGELKSNADIAGIAKIKTGEDKVEIKFKKSKTSVPIVTVSLGNGKFVQYSHQKVTEEGFEIILTEPASEDLEFSWFAIQSTEETNGDVMPQY